METNHKTPAIEDQGDVTVMQRTPDLKELAHSFDIESLTNQLDVPLVPGHSKDFPVFDLGNYDIYRITDTTAIDPPVPVITIAGEIISTEGNITTFSGASKAGKSALTAICIAGAICEYGRADGINGLDVERNHDKKAVIHIDTEQARHRQQNTVRAIIRRAQLQTCPDYYLSYNIRQLDLDKYAEVTLGIFEAANAKFGGIHLAVIDGLADYIKDVNEGEQSNAIIKFVESLAIKFKVPVIVIVHTNPGSDKERGHLGSQLQRKSESVISVKMDGDISYIEAKFLRMAGRGNIPQLSFKYCKQKGYHVDNGIMTNPEERKANAKQEAISSICKAVFSGQTAIVYKDAINKIREYSNKGESTAKEYFKVMKEGEMIIKGADENWRYSGIIPVQ